MDNLNLFSHPEAPEHVASDKAAGTPVQNPTFSDRPSADSAGSATKKS